MYELILENAAGDQLNFGMGSPFTISEIQGLNPPAATINTTQMALIDGAKYNSAKMNMRTINIAFAIEYEAAKNRLEVFKVLKSKQAIKLTYNSQYRNVVAEGYIQSINITYGAKKQIVTCAIVCPSPYLQAGEEIVNALENVINSFHFPFASTADPELNFGYINNEIGITIENGGDLDCGMIIQLNAVDAVTNPKIFNYITQDYFGLTFSMQASDQITIDTRKGYKSVTLLRNGVESNIFNSIMQGSTWLQLPAEGATFVYEVSSDNAGDLVVRFRHYPLCEGV